MKKQEPIIFGIIAVLVVAVVSPLSPHPAFAFVSDGIGTTTDL
jgi:hypothetical protein